MRLFLSLAFQGFMTLKKKKLYHLMIQPLFGFSAWKQAETSPWKSLCEFYISRI